MYVNNNTGNKLHYYAGDGRYNANNNYYSKMFFNESSVILLSVRNQPILQHLCGYKRSASPYQRESPAKQMFIVYPSHPGAELQAIFVVVNRNNHRGGSTMTL